MKITKVEVEAFRGYNGPRAFDCLADVVILCGPNGSGKTSFFDALAWGLFGDLSRLRGSRDVVGQSHLRNYFSTEDDPRVAIHLASGDQTALVTRRGKALLVVDGGVEHRAQAADDWIADRFRGPVGPAIGSLEDAERRFLSAHLLGQEEVAAFLRVNNPRERFDALATLLGVDLVRRFYAHTSGVEKDARATTKDLSARRASVGQRLETIRVELADLRVGMTGRTQELPLERLVPALVQLASDSRQFGGRPYVPPDDPVASELISVAEGLRAIITSGIDAARRRAAQLERLASDGLPSDEVSRNHGQVSREIEAVRGRQAAARKALESDTRGHDALKGQLAEAGAAFKAAKATTDEFQAFLLAAEPHVHSDQCPVCEQKIVRDRVAKRLRARAAQVPDALRRLQDRRIELETQERKLEGVISSRTAELGALDEEFRRLDGKRRKLEDQQRLRENALSEAGFTETPSAQTIAAERENEVARAMTGQDLAKRLDGLVSQLQYLASHDRRSRLADEEERLRSEQRRMEAALSKAEEGMEILKGITTAAKASELEIVKRLVVEQEPLLNALYGRLRPHPILDQLDVGFGDFSDRGEVYFHAVAGEARPNVAAIFSSAQLNAVAICIFLALNVSTAPNGPVLLDDPIQNMDDFNVLGLLDLLRSVAEGRQVIVSTHDNQLGNLMQRKLRPGRPGQRTIKHQFMSYDEQGPRVSTQSEEFEESPELVTALFG